MSTVTQTNSFSSSCDARTWPSMGSRKDGCTLQTLMYTSGSPVLSKCTTWKVRKARMAPSTVTSNETAVSSKMPRATAVWPT